MAANVLNGGGGGGGSSIDVGKVSIPNTSDPTVGQIFSNVENRAGDLMTQTNNVNYVPGREALNKDLLNIVNIYLEAAVMHYSRDESNFTALFCPITEVDRVPEIIHQTQYVPHNTVAMDLAYQTRGPEVGYEFREMETSFNRAGVSAQLSLEHFNDSPEDALDHARRLATQLMGAHYARINMAVMEYMCQMNQAHELLAHLQHVDRSIAEESLNPETARLHMFGLCQKGRGRMDLVSIANKHGQFCGSAPNILGASPDIMYQTRSRMKTTEQWMEIASSAKVLRRDENDPPGQIKTKYVEELGLTLAETPSSGLNAYATDPYDDCGIDAVRYALEGEAYPIRQMCAKQLVEHACRYNKIVPMPGVQVPMFASRRAEIITFKDAWLSGIMDVGGTGLGFAVDYNPGAGSSGGGGGFGGTATPSHRSSFHGDFPSFADTPFHMGTSGLGPSSSSSYGQNMSRPRDNMLNVQDMSPASYWSCWEPRAGPSIESSGSSILRMTGAAYRMNRCEVSENPRNFRSGRDCISFEEEGLPEEMISGPGSMFGYGMWVSQRAGILSRSVGQASSGMRSVYDDISKAHQSWCSLVCESVGTKLRASHVHSLYRDLLTVIFDGRVPANYNQFNYQRMQHMGGSLFCQDDHQLAKIQNELTRSYVPAKRDHTSSTTGEGDKSDLQRLVPAFFLLLALQEHGATGLLEMVNVVAQHVFLNTRHNPTYIDVLICFIAQQLGVLLYMNPSLSGAYVEEQPRHMDLNLVLDICFGDEDAKTKFEALQGELEVSGRGSHVLRDISMTIDDQRRNRDDPRRAEELVRGDEDVDMGDDSKEDSTKPRSDSASSDPFVKPAPRGRSKTPAPRGRSETPAPRGRSKTSVSRKPSVGPASRGRSIDPAPRVPSATPASDEVDSQSDLFDFQNITELQRHFFEQKHDDPDLTQWMSDFLQVNLLPRKYKLDELRAATEKETDEPIRDISLVLIDIASYFQSDKKDDALDKTIMRNVRHIAKKSAESNKLGYESAMSSRGPKAPQRAHNHIQNAKINLMKTEFISYLVAVTNNEYVLPFQSEGHMKEDLDPIIYHLAVNLKLHGALRKDSPWVFNDDGVPKTTHVGEMKDFSNTAVKAYLDSRRTDLVESNKFSLQRTLFLIAQSYTETREVKDVISLYTDPQATVFPHDFHLGPQPETTDAPATAGLGSAGVGSYFKAFKYFKAPLFTMAREITKASEINGSSAAFNGQQLSSLLLSLVETGKVDSAGTTMLDIEQTDTCQRSAFAGALLSTVLALPFPKHDLLWFDSNSVSITFRELGILPPFEFMIQAAKLLETHSLIMGATGVGDNSAPPATVCVDRLSVFKSAGGINAENIGTYGHFIICPRDVRRVLVIPDAFVRGLRVAGNTVLVQSGGIRQWYDQLNNMSTLNGCDPMASGDAQDLANFPGAYAFPRHLGEKIHPMNSITGRRHLAHHHQSQIIDDYAMAECFQARTGSHCNEMLNPPYIAGVTNLVTGDYDKKLGRGSFNSMGREVKQQTPLGCCNSMVYSSDRETFIYSHENKGCSAFGKRTNPEVFSNEYSGGQIFFAGIEENREPMQPMIA